MILHRWVARGALVLGMMACSTSGAYAQVERETISSRVSRPIVHLSSLSMIDTVLAQRDGRPIDAPHRLDILDLTGDGFGAGDVVVVYPSGETFLLPDVLPGALRRLMDRWGPVTVSAPDRALSGLSEVGRLDTRQLAARTVMLGSYDFDLSGSIDRAAEIDAPSCEVWAALEAALPGFREQLGFEAPLAAYRGALILNIGANVRSAAVGRIAACAAGEAPEATDPASIEPPTTASLSPTGVNEFLVAATAAELVRDLGSLTRSRADWAARARSLLLDRYDRDRSGRLDRTNELNAIPCSVWQALAATSPETPSALGAVPELPGIELGFAPESSGTVRSLYRPCLQPRAGMARVAIRERIAAPTPLPPYAIRAAVTVPLRGLARVSDESRRYLPAKTVLLAMFDSDGSGAIDDNAELDQIPCEVWSALDTTFPDFGLRFGFVPTTGGVPYRGDLIFSISNRLREPAARRMGACERGDTPPRASTPEASRAPRELVVSAELKAFLDLETASTIVRTASALPAGSASWAAAIRSILLSTYDLDESGLLDRAREIDEVPCVVWATAEATYGAPLDGLLTGPDGGLGSQAVGIAPARAAQVAARIGTCR